MTEFVVYSLRPDTGEYLDVLPVLESSMPTVVFSGPCMTKYSGPAVHPHLSIHIGAFEKLVAYPKLEQDPYSVFLLFEKWYQLQSVESYVVERGLNPLFHRSSDIMNMDLKYVDPDYQAQKMLGFEAPSLSLERRWDLLNSNQRLLGGMREIALSEIELHNQIFMHNPEALVVQTCIRHGFDVTWGRMFYTYLPVTE